MALQPENVLANCGKDFLFCLRKDLELGTEDTVMKKTAIVFL